MRIAWIVLAVPALAQTPPSTTPRDVIHAVIEQQHAAMEMQHECARLQARNAGAARLDDVLPMPVFTPEPEPVCEPMSESDLMRLVETTSKEVRINARLIRTIIEQQSAGRPCATSARNAKGLMQLMPDTITQFGVSNAFDPKENIEAGTKYLKQLLGKYKENLPLSLKAFHAGPAAVDGVDLPETAKFVESVLKNMSKE